MPRGFGFHRPDSGARSFSSAGLLTQKIHCLELFETGSLSLTVVASCFSCHADSIVMVV